jgi:hypothetical protein
MRFLLCAMIVAGAIVSGSAASEAQVCTTRIVDHGYDLTALDGFHYSCCAGYGQGGTCVLRTCKVGVKARLSASRLPQYMYERIFQSQKCLGPFVG